MHPADISTEKGHFPVAIFFFSDRAWKYPRYQV
jgi:hypothetical protein